MRQQNLAVAILHLPSVTAHHQCSELQSSTKRSTRYREAAEAQDDLGSGQEQCNGHPEDPEGSQSAAGQDASNLAGVSICSNHLSPTASCRRPPSGPQITDNAPISRSFAYHSATLDHLTKKLDICLLSDLWSFIREIVFVPRIRCTDSQGQYVLMTSQGFPILFGQNTEKELFCLAPAMGDWVAKRGMTQVGGEDSLGVPWHLLVAQSCWECVANRALELARWKTPVRCAARFKKPQYSSVANVPRPDRAKLILRVHLPFLFFSSSSHLTSPHIQLYYIFIYITFHILPSLACFCSSSRWWLLAIQVVGAAKTNTSSPRLSFGQSLKEWSQIKVGLRGQHINVGLCNVIQKNFRHTHTLTHRGSVISHSWWCEILKI